MRRGKKTQAMFLKYALIMLAGGAAGYAYYRLVGCRSGACAITANPYLSILYGAVMGAFVAGMAG
jgi:hypothetical protein